MITVQERLRTFFIGFYTWIVTVYFGAVLLDTIYSKLIHETTTAFSEVSDFLLLIGFMTFLAAVGAITFSWKSSIARNYFLASLVILFFEFLISVFFYQFIQDTQGSGLSTTIRIIINGTTSILAFIGFHKFYRQR